MAVRFLPPPDDRGESRDEHRSDLAEVIELRSRLQQISVRGKNERERPQQLDSGASPMTHEDSGLTQVAELSELAEAPELAEEPEFFDEPEHLLATAAQTRDCYDDGVRILGRRARSSGELRAELLRLAHPPDEVERVIKEFVSNLYLDDRGLARTATQKLREVKRLGSAQIRTKLRERKLPDGVIEEAIAELDSSDEWELLREVAGRRANKMSGLDRQTAERRLLGYLARRGWSGDQAMRAAREALDSEAVGQSGHNAGMSTLGTGSSASSARKRASDVRFR